jgi:hypothetical protein
MATSNDTMTGTAASDSRARKTVASYPSYAEAEHAVDSLSDQGVAVEHVAIVGKGLRSVEQVTGRMTAARAALVGLGEGALIGTLFALLFGIFFNGPAFGYLLLCSVVAGGLFGVTIGLIANAVDSDGRRDFVSETSISADRYEVQADDEVVAEARSALASTPGSLGVSANETRTRSIRAHAHGRLLPSGCARRAWSRCVACGCGPCWERRTARPRSPAPSGCWAGSGRREARPR